MFLVFLCVLHLLFAALGVLINDDYDRPLFDLAAMQGCNQCSVMWYRAVALQCVVTASSSHLPCVGLTGKEIKSVVYYQPLQLNSAPLMLSRRQHCRLNLLMNVCIICTTVTDQFIALLHTE